MQLKLLFLLAIMAAGLLLTEQVWLCWVQPEMMTDAALKQMQRSNQPTRWVNTVNQFQQGLQTAQMLVFLSVVFVLGFWKRPKRAQAK